MGGPAVDVAVDDFAAAIERALHPVSGAGNGTEKDFSLRDNPAGRNGDEMSLAALRVLGVDALAPFVLAGHPLPDGDADLVWESVRAFPAPRMDGTDGAAMWRFRDWALARVLRSLAPATVVPVPDAVPTTRAAAAATWQGWCAELAMLTALALPGIHTEVRATVAARRRDLTRGVARAMLRKDMLTAARLARWAALDDAEHPDPLVPVALDHLAVLGSAQPQVLLQVAVARCLLARDR